MENYAPNVKYWGAPKDYETNVPTVEESPVSERDKERKSEIIIDTDELDRKPLRRRRVWNRIRDVPNDWNQIPDNEIHRTSSLTDRLN